MELEKNEGQVTHFGKFDTFLKEKQHSGLVGYEDGGLKVVSKFSQSFQVSKLSRVDEEQWLVMGVVM